MGIVEGLAVWVSISLLFAAGVGKLLEVADRRTEVKNHQRLRAAGY
ncbi:MAG TPA: hypothetical protein VGL89_20155 [Candidatus Koribacter sp.]